MAYQITNNCIMCGMCELECAADAIYESGVKYDINKDACTECKACLEVCPTLAIVEASDSI